MNRTSAYPTTVAKHAGHRRMKRWMVGLSLLLLLASPLLVVLPFTNVNVIQSVEAAFKNNVNPRANYWRAVRKGDAGTTQSDSPESNVLIQNGGQNWREIRNGPIATIGGWAFAVVVVLIVLFHLTVGKAKLERRSGRKIPRWNLFERVLHWYVAILFILLALSGLVILYGRAILLPVMGYAGFDALAHLAKPVHNYLALFFVLGLVIMLVIWFRDNIMHKVDWEWLRGGGSYMGKHAHAGKVNGGEKIWFWILFIAGIVLMVSGVILLFPNFGFERSTMQDADIYHGISALILSTVVLGHIYLGTIGNEGTFEGMISGEVDETWAKQHHDLWYEQTGGKGDVSEPATPPRQTT